MALAVEWEEVQRRQDRRGTDVIDPVRGKLTGGIVISPYFRFPDQPELPHALHTLHDPGRVSTSHFHVRDQFQFIIGGGGSLGKHPLSRYSLHFSRAFTPYGPLVADAKAGLEFIVMRPKLDPGAKRLDDSTSLDLLNSVSERKPWQVTRPVEFPAESWFSGKENALLAEVPDIKDADGLAAYALSLKAGCSLHTPDASTGGGQYIVVVKGSLLYKGTEYPTLSMLFIAPGDNSVSITAGAQGLQALIAGFPRQQASGVSADQPVQTDLQPTSRQWNCSLCSFSYDEAHGLPEEGIEPGTRWEQVAEDWVCPDCGASKEFFDPDE